VGLTRFTVSTSGWVGDAAAELAYVFEVADVTDLDGETPAALLAAVNAGGAERRPLGVFSPSTAVATLQLGIPSPTIGNTSSQYGEHAQYQVVLWVLVCSFRKGALRT